MIKQLNVGDATFMFAPVDKMTWWGEHQSVTRSASAIRQGNGAFYSFLSFFNDRNFYFSIIYGIFVTKTSDITF